MIYTMSLWLVKYEQICGDRKGPQQMAYVLTAEKDWKQVSQSLLTGQAPGAGVMIKEIEWLGQAHCPERTFIDPPNENDE